jgi:hypothetical protein
VDWEKVSSGILAFAEGATEILFGLPVTATAPPNLALIGKGLADYALGFNKIREGFRGVEGPGAPANLSELIADGMSKLTGASVEETRSKAGLLDVALTGMAGAYPRSGVRNWGPSTYGINGRSSPIASAKGVHKNSLEYVGDTHVYRIKGPDGKTYRIGQSAQGTRVSDGASIRAEKQVRQLNRTVGPGHTSEIRKTFPDKASARAYETRLIERFQRRFGRDALPGNMTNR